MKLRDYQLSIYDQIINAHTNDLVQLDTGGGKTHIEAALCESSNYSMIVAHRNILICQCSEKLAAFGLDHDTVSTEFTRRRCMAYHLRHGKNYIKRGHSSRLVASIDSLLVQYDSDQLEIDTQKPWLIVIDEAHHVVAENKWGRLRDIFTNSRIVGFTATPARLDGVSLHTESGGIFDRLVQADSLRCDSVGRLISSGYLSDFIVYTPTERLKKSRSEIDIATDPINAYLKFAKCLRTVIMCASISDAELIASKFRSAGVSAAYIHSKQSATLNFRILERFSAGEMQILCNVDMISEGFDLPGIEALILLRKTNSLVLYRQWIGRALRPLHAKKHAVIIDLVDNVNWHGMPDDQINWDIKTYPSQLQEFSHIPCLECGRWYVLTNRTCPGCSAKNPLYDRVNEETGRRVRDLVSVDVGLMLKTRREIDEVDRVERLKTEIVSLNGREFSNYGAIGSAFNKVQRWIIDTMQEKGEKIENINKFLLMKTSERYDFIIENFTINDVKKNNHNKAMRVFNKWLKLN